MHAFVRRDSELLLLKRANTGYRDGWYSVPAGRLEDGETVTACVVRELAEETGLTTTAADLSPPLVVHRYASDGFGSCINFFFEIRAWHGMPINAEPEKCSDLRFFSADSLPDRTIPYIRHAIERFTAGHRYAEFGWNDP